MELDLTSNYFEIVVPHFDHKKPYKIVGLSEALKEVEINGSRIIGRNRILSPDTKKTFKQRIREMYNYTCYYCGRYGDTVEHIIPQSQGGKNTFDNCLCACAECNNTRGTMPIQEFVDWVNFKLELLKI